MTPKQVHLNENVKGKSYRRNKQNLEILTIKLNEKQVKNGQPISVQCTLYFPKIGCTKIDFCKLIAEKNIFHYNNNLEIILSD